LLLEQHELLRRRIFIAKAERVDVTQLELEFAETKAKLDELAKAFGEDETGAEAPESTDPKKKQRAKPKGRRDLSQVDWPTSRIEISDPELEGKFECIGFVDSYRIGYQRGGRVRIHIARKIYKTVGADGQAVLRARRYVGRTAAGEETRAPPAEAPPARRRVFEWARAEHDKNHERGLVATALGYAVRQEDALRRFLDDGRLRMENNAAERGLRPIAIGRKNCRATDISSSPRSTGPRRVPASVPSSLRPSTGRSTCRIPASPANSPLSIAQSDDLRRPLEGERHGDVCPPPRAPSGARLEGCDWHDHQTGGESPNLGPTEGTRHRRDKGVDLEHQAAVEA
jgi:hypothetical protein